MRLKMTGAIVRDLQSDSEVGAVTLEGEPLTTVRLVEDVPLRHKVALRDIQAGIEVVEYDRPIRAATDDFRFRSEGRVLAGQ